MVLDKQDAQARRSGGTQSAGRSLSGCLALPAQSAAGSRQDRLLGQFAELRAVNLSAQQADIGRRHGQRAGRQGHLADACRLDQARSGQALHLPVEQQQIVGRTGGSGRQQPDQRLVAAGRMIDMGAADRRQHGHRLSRVGA
jgi:hypothetical protein